MKGGHGLNHSIPPHPQGERGQNPSRSRHLKKFTNFVKHTRRVPPGGGFVFRRGKEYDGVITSSFLSFLQSAGP